MAADLILKGRGALHVNLCALREGPKIREAEGFVNDVKGHPCLAHGGHR